VERKGKTEIHTKFWWGKMKQTDHIEIHGTLQRITFIWMLKKYDDRAGNGLIWLRIGTS
jgi:hypothetical protein